jgi:hypothetical protein
MKLEKQKIKNKQQKVLTSEMFPVDVATTMLSVLPPAAIATVAVASLGVGKRP